MNTIASLHQLQPWRAVVRTLGQLLFLVALALSTLSLSNPWAFGAGALLTAFVYFNTLLFSHDCIHDALTGWRWYDSTLARLVAYPGFWFHGAYRRLHHIHHRMNGVDLLDPERRQTTREEYLASSRFSQWHQRSAWWVDPLVLGGAGMIVRLFMQSWRWSRQDSAIRRSLAYDVIGVITLNILIWGIAYRFGVLARYAVLFLTVERVAGFLNQLRSHVEHHGLWAQREGRRWQTYAASSRNFEVPEAVSLFFGRLNFHSVHHVYPKIPYYHLKRAHQLLTPEWKRTGTKLTTSGSYLSALRSLSRRPFIDGFGLTVHHSPFQ